MYWNILSLPKADSVLPYFSEMDTNIRTKTKMRVQTLFIFWESAILQIAFEICSNLRHQNKQTYSFCKETANFCSHLVLNLVAFGISLVIEANKFLPKSCKIVVSSKRTRKAPSCTAAKSLTSYYPCCGWCREIARAADSVFWKSSTTKNRLLELRWTLVKIFGHFVFVLKTSCMHILNSLKLRPVS